MYESRQKLNSTESGQDLAASLGFFSFLLLFFYFTITFWGGLEQIQIGSGREDAVMRNKQERVNTTAIISMIM